MDHKLDDELAEDGGAQLLKALRQLQARREWSDGDLIAVCTIAFTELVARAVGPVRTAEFFRGHGDELAKEHLRRSLS